MQIIYQAEDGTQFLYEQECKDYEKEKCLIDLSSARNWLKGYSGKRILDRYKLTDTGTWQIYGEDPNCDFGGYHHMPYLATVSGVLSDVVVHAVKLDRFFTWGSGGDIRRVEVESV